VAVVINVKSILANLLKFTTAGSAIIGSVSTATKTLKKLKLSLFLFLLAQDLFNRKTRF
jgi:hypothetical protein